MKHSEEFKDIALAFSKAQGEMEFAEKSGVNPHFKSKYATLAAVVDACKAALTNNEIAVVQYGHECDNGVKLETVFYHSSGQYISAGITHVPAGKYDAHGYGSALTYARRYALSTACGVPQEDDDGNAAKANPPPRSSGRKPESVAKTVVDEVHGGNVDWAAVSEYVPSIEAGVASEDITGVAQLLAECAGDQPLWDGIWTKLGSKDRSYLKKNFVFDEVSQGLVPR